MDLFQNYIKNSFKLSSQRAFACYSLFKVAVQQMLLNFKKKECVSSLTDRRADTLASLQRGGQVPFNECVRFRHNLWISGRLIGGHRPETFLTVFANVFAVSQCSALRTKLFIICIPASVSYYAHFLLITAFFAPKESLVQQNVRSNWTISGPNVPLPSIETTFSCLSFKHF